MRFTNATETLLWAKKSEKGKYTFNHRRMKAENGGKQMTNVWTFPLCNGKERLRNEDGKKLHSTQKPAALLRRVILSSTNVGDVVLDPFLGTGTTMAVARCLKRLSVGIESNSLYVEEADKRVLQITQETCIEVLYKKPLLVPFKKLIEEGFIKKGRKLYFNKSSKAAIILQSGKIRIEGNRGIIGSIHKVGAKAAGTAQCNGWVHWYLKEKGDFVILADIREKYRRLLVKGKT
ncbi:MAG: site-specific DNA-methyltransferase [Gammaproteobacteria bacterium]